MTEKWETVKNNQDYEDPNQYKRRYESKWDTQRKNHNENQDPYNKLNLGARPKVTINQE